MSDFYLDMIILFARIKAGCRVYVDNSACQLNKCCTEVSIRAVYIPRNNLVHGRTDRTIGTTKINQVMLIMDKYYISEYFPSFLGIKLKNPPFTLYCRPMTTMHLLVKPVPEGRLRYTLIQVHFQYFKSNLYPLTISVVYQVWDRIGRHFQPTPVFVSTQSIRCLKLVSARLITVEMSVAISLVNSKRNK